jgi:hypothetical protein
MRFLFRPVARCPLWVGSSHHAATAPVDPFRLDAASVNDRFRLGAVGRVRTAHCLQFPIPDIGRRARRAIVIA